VIFSPCLLSNLAWFFQILICNMSCVVGRIIIDVYIYLCGLFSRLLEMQKLHITIIQVGLGSSFRWTTRRMAWFMGKFAENFVSLNTSLFYVGLMFWTLLFETMNEVWIIRDRSWDITVSIVIWLWAGWSRVQFPARVRFI